MHMASALGHFIIFVPIPFITIYVSRVDAPDPLNPYGKYNCSIKSTQKCPSAYLYISTTGAVFNAMLNLLITNVHPLMCMIFCKTIRLRLLEYFEKILRMKKPNAVAPLVEQMENKKIQNVVRFIFTNLFIYLL